VTRGAAAAVVSLLVGLALVAGAGPAAAHDTLVSSDPANDASVASGPQRVTLTFDQPVNRGFNTVTVTGPGGTAWASGEVTVSGSTLSTAVLPLGPAGEYVIGYRIVSADGHPATGTVRFRLTEAGTGTPAPPAAAAPGIGGSQGGMPVWPWVLASIALLAAGVAMALRLGRRPES
jgi:methionine-rich copper-binding protein CopC